MNAPDDLTSTLTPKVEVVQHGLGVFGHIGVKRNTNKPSLVGTSKEKGNGK